MNNWFVNIIDVGQVTSASCNSITYVEVGLWLNCDLDFYLYGYLYCAWFLPYLRRIKKRIGFQLGMNISIVMGGMIALLSGVLLILQFPFHFTLITIISTLVGLVSRRIVWTVIRLPNFCDWLNEWNGHWVNVSDDWNSYRNAVRCLFGSFTAYLY